MRRIDRRFPADHRIQHHTAPLRGALHLDRSARRMLISVVGQPLSLGRDGGWDVDDHTTPNYVSCLQTRRVSLRIALLQAYVFALALALALAQL